MEAIPSDLVSGMGWALAAGAMQGGSLLPMKFTHGWRGEHIWLVSSVLGLVVFPWWIACWASPRVDGGARGIAAHTQAGLRVAALVAAGFL